jgi:NADH dehydrogenase FAD-containing subunit
MTVRRLWLVGGGHAHALLLRAWARQGLPADAAVTLLSPSPTTPYSGMVPGWLAGTYRFDEISIDMQALAARAGVVFRRGEVAGLDATARLLRLQDGAVEGFDLLSINVGSTLAPPAWPQVRVLPLRPLSALQTAWQAVQDGRPPSGLLTVGGGAAGVEATLAVASALRQLHPGWHGPGRLVERGKSLLAGLPPAAQRAAFDALARAGIAVQCSTAALPSMAPRGTLVLWAAGATAHAWQAASGPATDAGGFISTDATLRSTSHPQVFASGDCASLAQPLPKAGVYAVRQGPLLAHNLRAALAGQALKSFDGGGPALALLSTADGRAIAARGPWSASGPHIGKLLWRWKDRIDRAFVRGPGS